MSREDKTSEKICCPGSSSPFCLGMTDYNCCGVPDPKRKKLKKKPEKPKPLSPSSRFNTTVSSEEIEKSSKGCIPVGTAKSTNWRSVHFSNGLYSRKNILLRLFVIVYNVMFRRPGESMGHNTPLALFTKCFVDYFGIHRSS